MYWRKSINFTHFGTIVTFLLAFSSTDSADIYIFFVLLKLQCRIIKTLSDHNHDNHVHLKQRVILNKEINYSLSETVLCHRRKK